MEYQGMILEARIAMHNFNVEYEVLIDIKVNK